MSTYKAVFSDIDGTLLTSEHIVSTATIEAIASLRIKIFLLLSFLPEVQAAFTRF